MSKRLHDPQPPRADPDHGRQPGLHGSTAAYVFTAPGLNHGANVAGLVAEQNALATARILQWAGVPAASTAQAKPLAGFDSRLDVRDVEREPALRP